MDKLRMNIISEIYNLLVNKNIFEIYDNLSMEEHKKIFEKNNIIVYESICYGYVDIIGLNGSEFSILQDALNYTK